MRIIFVNYYIISSTGDMLAIMYIEKLLDCIQV